MSTERSLLNRLDAKKHLFEPAGSVYVVDGGRAAAVADDEEGEIRVGLELAWPIPAYIAVVGAVAGIVIAGYWLFAAGYERRMRARFRGRIPVATDRQPSPHTVSMPRGRRRSGRRRAARATSVGGPAGFGRWVVPVRRDTPRIANRTPRPIGGHRRRAATGGTGDARGT